MSLYSSNSGVSTGSSPAQSSDPCDSTWAGYQCQPQISHFWGQYSPYFSVPSEISAKVPHNCEITFAQILSRHGARDPTASKTKVYNETIAQIKANATAFSGPSAFLAKYSYTLGADQLTTFGQDQMVKSGIKFYTHYASLARTVEPFIRSSSEDRVVESAMNWTEGFHAAKLADKSAAGGDQYPYPIVLQYEGDDLNNTLNHAICTEFESGTYSEIGDDAQAAWAKIFIPPIQARLNADLPGANLSIDQTIYMMDLCPFNTVADEDGLISPFCALFTELEWVQYDYYESLGKYYGYSYGNPLGPTQGVGFVNELIARLTDAPVQDHTSTNHTLDDSPATFPLGRKLYADFSHDNDMTAIFSALGLYNDTLPLPNTTVVEAEAASGYSASWTASFASRAYVEKMQCHGHREELVRVIVNDRVQPLTQCGGDDLGRCSLTNFVGSLGFAKAGGHWDQCFA
ncbi:3-phytase A [Cladophialophora carrionii]|uniref:Phytase A n=1 Tax=Cladophialophora carrionii TaxID=86049 RepID=A0A1C1CW33_9EURO|nr:3-phytase A [Cladophialophora carrionii]